MDDNELLDPTVKDFYFISFLTNSIIRVSKNNVDKSTIPDHFHIDNKRKFMFHLGDEDYRCMICLENYVKNPLEPYYCDTILDRPSRLKRHILIKSKYWGVKIWSLNDDLEIPTGRLFGDVKRFCTLNMDGLRSLKFFNGESFVTINDWKCPIKKCCNNKNYFSLVHLLGHVGFLETKEKRIMIKEVDEDDDQDAHSYLDWQPGQSANEEIVKDDQWNLQFNQLADKRTYDKEKNQLKRKIDEIDAPDSSQADEETNKSTESERLKTIIKYLNEKNKELVMIINKQNEEKKKNQKEISNLNTVLEENRYKVDYLEAALMEMHKINENIFEAYALKFNS